MFFTFLIGFLLNFHLVTFSDEFSKLIDKVGSHTVVDRKNKPHIVNAPNYRDTG